MADSISIKDSDSRLKKVVNLYTCGLCSIVLSPKVAKHY